MRTRSLTLAFVTAASVSACATNPRVEGIEPEGPPALRVWIGFPAGRSQVYPIFTNREAYVAMFEIVPGRGVTMVYPSMGDRRYATDMHYANLTVQRGRWYYFSDPFGFASYKPRYYYAVASVAPLNLTRLQSSLGATRRTLGRLYASYRPFDVIDRLTEIVVPMQPDEEWATDLFVHWPVQFTPRSFLALQWVRCANGRVLMVAGSYPYFGCPGDTRLAVIATAVKAPIKELPFEPRPRPPQGDDRRGIELAAPDVEKRRRAEPGAQPPRSGSTTRTPSSEGIRYAEDRPLPQRSTQPARPPAAERPPSPENSGKSQTVDRGEPRVQPAPERGGGRKDP
jgi:hypothetical protein